MMDLKEPMFCEIECGELGVYDYCINVFVGPWPHRDRDCRIGSGFCKLYFIKIGFTLGELIYSMIVFRLFRLKWTFFNV
jgi:hypothetical protein